MGGRLNQGMGGPSQGRSVGQPTPSFTPIDYTSPMPRAPRPASGPYQSQQPRSPLGADMAGGIRAGMTGALPGISDHFADNFTHPDNAGARRKAAAAEFIDAGFDDYQQQIIEQMRSKGYNYPDAAMLRQLQSMRPDIARQIANSGQRTIDARRAAMPQPPAAPVVNNGMFPGDIPWWASPGAPNGGESSSGPGPGPGPSGGGGSSGDNGVGDE